MPRQNALGKREVHKMPSFNDTRIARVTGTSKYETYGMIDVICLDYSQPFPVWVSGDIDRKPSDGDQVLIGFIHGRKDAPYLISFVRGYTATDDYIKVEKGKITLQIPNSGNSIEITENGTYINGVRQ